MRGRRHKLQVSTFPFLAVLLCAMGSLILVLLVMDRKAHQAAQARAQREAARLAEEHARGAAAQQAERERLQQQARTAWERKREVLHDKLTREQIEIQLQMRKVREQLQEIAARLHYEQDTSTQLRRKVQDKRSRLQAEEQLLRTLRSRSEQAANQSKESSQALRRLTLELLQMEQALKDLKAARQREQKTFSVVPYHGRRGENRRPIYVECTAGGVIFHPERKAMPVASLVPGSGDSSSEVRAEVERRIAQQHTKLTALPANVDKTPYLLLLLRPGGVTTYHLFQAALKGLEVDFGYEFIDDDWVLDFPADDEQPSTQPWMIATKSSSLSAPAPTASSSPRTNNRPIGLAPMGDPEGASAGGIRGFRAGEAGGIGNWVRGPGTSGVSAGTGSSMPGGTGGTGGSSSSVRGLPGMSGGGGSGTGRGGGSGSNLAGHSGGPSSPLSGATSSFSPSAPFSQSGGGESGSLSSSSGGGSGGGGEGNGFGVGSNRSNGRGHPAALAPSFREGGGGGGFSGDGAPPPNGFYGSGAFSLRGSAIAQGYGSSIEGSPGVGGSEQPGVGGSGSPGSGNGSGSPGVGASGSPAVGGSGSLGSGGSDLPGLGPPRALPSSSQGYMGGGTEQSGIAGTGSPRTGAPGNSMAGGGTAGSALSGSAAGTGASGDGRYVVAQGNNGGGGSGQTSNLGGSGAGISNPAAPGAPGSVSGSQAPLGNPAREALLRPSPLGPDAAAKQSFTSVRSQAELGNEGAGSNPPMQGSGGSSSGTQPVTGGNLGTQAPGGTPMPANGSRSSDAVIYVDPLTGKPTTAPRLTTPAAGGPTEDRPPETDGKQGTPRVRVIVGNGGGAGEGGDPQSEAMNRFAPTPSVGPPRHKPAALRPAWVHGGRDWTIYVECRADSLVLYPSLRTFPLAQVMSDPTGNPLLKAIQQMIDRRQSSRRPGEPPYCPQLCLLVRPEHIRTFLTVYPALEALPVPKTRRNLDADDDVIDIINGASP
jgi:hypothetical protein